MRLLISAQDSGSRVSLLPIFAAAKKRCEIHAVVPAGDKIFPQENVSRVSLDEVEALVDRFKPNIVLTGISGEGIGLDEAIIKHCKGRIPTWSFQDYWGYVNQSAGVYADHIMVMDERAKAITANYIKANLHVVGTSKCEYFLNRKEQIESQRAEVKNKGILFIGQPLWKVPGYAETLAMVGAAGKPALYLAHPLEKETSSLPSGITLADRKNFGIEAFLLEASHAISCFSTALFDGLLLKSLFKQSQPKLASMMISPEMIAEHAKYGGGTKEFPLAGNGVAAIQNPSDLAQFLADDTPLAYDGALAVPGASERIVKLLHD